MYPGQPLHCSSKPVLRELDEVSVGEDGNGGVVGMIDCGNHIAATDKPFHCGAVK